MATQIASPPVRLNNAGAQFLTAAEERLASFALALIVPVLIHLRVVEFLSWGQVEIFWAYRLTPEAIAGHPHYFRYLVTYPGFLLTDTGLETAFSFYICLFLLTGQLLLRRTIIDTSRVAAIAAQIVYISAHFFMNGRGAIAWAAWVMAIYAISHAEQRGWKIWHGALIALAVLCSTVSSGAMIVVYVTVIAVFFRCLFVPSDRRGAIFLFPVIGFFLNYALVSIDKNVTYYDEGNTAAILNMLSHGWGALLAQSWTFILLAVIGSVILPYVVYYYASRFTFSKVMFLLAPMIGGAFGFTTLTLAVPSLLTTLMDQRGRLRLST